MPRRERIKGKVAELEVVHAFDDAGFPCRRSGDTGQIVGDLDGLPDLYVEVRRRERLDMPGWIREVADETPEGKVGVLAFRRSREPWHVCIGLEDFLTLLQEAKR